MTLYIPEIPLGDFEAQTVVRRQLEQQGTAPRLGLLAPLAARLALITGRTNLSFPRKTVVIMAADHAHPGGDPERTAADVTRLARGEGAANALARQAGATLTLVDLGLAQPLRLPGLENLPVTRGTRNLLDEPALGLPQVNDALMIGMHLASAEIGRGLDLLAPAELAAGSELPALAVIHLLTGRQPDELTPDAAQAARVEAAVARHRPDRHDPFDVLRTVGSLELAGMAGLMLAGAAGRVPIVLDGLAAAAAALLAAHINPALRPYLIAGHRSGQPAHDLVLRQLGLPPLLDLGLSAPAGCGALLAFHLVEAAARILNETASGGEAPPSIEISDQLL